MTEAKIIPAVAAVTTSITIQLVVILAFNSISAQPPHALTTTAALWELGGEMPRSSTDINYKYALKLLNKKRMQLLKQLRLSIRYDHSLLFPSLC